LKLARCCPRSFTFYVAHPIGSVVDLGDIGRRASNDYIPSWMSTVQEIKAAIKALPDADFREVSRAVDEMEADRFDRALDDAAQSGKFDSWLKKVDVDIDAGRTKPLAEIINDA
jgi:hypothetical protein